MTNRDDTIAALEAALGDKPAKFQLRFALAKSHSDRLVHLRQAVDFILQEHVKTRQLRQDRSEDGLTIDVVDALTMMGFQASHDTQIGGHVDILVQGRDNFIWLAEAKKHGSYKWLLDGFIQLETYSTGLPGQDMGDVIIYHFGQRSNKVMERWLRFLKTARPDVEIVVADEKNLVRETKHDHLATGRRLDFRHTIVPLYWPTLATAKGSAPSP